ncbi:MAG: dicarboxylate/amino acid:cation symporter [Fimbriimonadaceae bacterium]|nr:cation:dicarboxylase symporter family transporter [Chthonomonadaceae bacterium]MCO5297171.1 dicarboxylate/amino acid:cation symporter [Fimbriimonadaceae bacterium]
MADARPPARTSRWILIGGPLGLALGFAIGSFADTSSLLPIFQPIGALWMNAMRVAVVPLTVCLLVLGVCSLPRGKDLGRWGSAMFACFLALLVAGAAITLLIGVPYLAAYGPAPIDLPQIAGRVPAETPPAKPWTDILLPSNLFAAAASGELLSLCVLAILFGFAVRSLPLESRRPLELLFASLRDATLTFVRWTVALLPIGAFSLALAFGASSGFRVAREIVHFTVFATALMLLLCLLVMIATRLAGRLRWADYFRVILPIQAVAVGTRSSIATLPSVIEGAQRLGLPEPAIDLVVPGSSSLFKANRIVSSTAKVLFMAALFHVTLDPATIAVFLGTIAILAFASPGIPSVATGSTFGAYLAAGIPAEGIVMFEVANSLTDFAKTALNVTANLAVAVLASRWVARSEAKAASGRPLQSSPI